MIAQPGSRLRAAYAAVLSLVIPGLGQVHARAWRAGLVLLGINEALSLGARVLTAAAPPILPAIAAVAAVVLVSIALMFASAFDAWRRVRAAPVPPRPRWFRSTWFAAIVLIGLGLAVDIVLPFGWRTFNIPSGSMTPTLMVGDFLLADTRAAYTPTRGDVVIFSHDDVDYVKRIIALPGDRIAMADGVPVLNGTPLAQTPDGEFVVPEPMSFGTKTRRLIETLPGGPSYPVLQLPSGSFRSMPEMTVPAGKLFMLGDHRDNSMDSRSAIGTVAIDAVIGPARTLYWSRDQSRILTTVR